MTTTDPPSRPGLRSVSASSGQEGFDLLTALGQQLGETVERKKHRGRKLKSVTFEYGTDARGAHDMAGTDGYSLASNWFTQRVAQLLVANSLSKSEVCVFLYVAGGQQDNGSGITQYTQQEIADGLNRLAVKTGARCMTRNTVNRAIRSLCENGWLEKPGNGRVQLNIRLWYRGNSAMQQQALEALGRHYGTTENDFPNRIGPDLGHLGLPKPSGAIDDQLADGEDEAVHHEVLAPREGHAG